MYLHHVLEYALEMGLCTLSPMGNTPLSFTDIKAYSDLSGLEIPLEEVKIIREASVTYVRFLHEGKKDDCPVPYQDNTIEARKQRDTDIKSKVNEFKERMAAR